jgi:predicted LPLAT superfamily acyltransferase
MAHAMKPGAGHWASINETGFVAGMRLLFWIGRVCGRWPFRIVLYPVLGWYLATRPVARRASADYLSRVGARVRVATGLWGVLRHFAAFAETLLDKLLLWGGLFDTSQVSYAGIEPMLHLIERRQGVLLICSHLGNLELCRVLAQRRPGLKLTVLVHTGHARAFNALLARLDPRSQLNLLQVTEMTPATAISLAERIGRGEFVVIAGDRIPVAPNPRVAQADFLGQRAAFPIGPYVLASVLQCPLYMLFSMRRLAGHELHFELLREAVHLPRQGREQVLARLAADYAARLEFHCIRAPLDWFNFYDFWHSPDLESADAPR